MIFQPRSVLALATLSLHHTVAATPSDCTPGTWKSLSSIPTPRQEHSTVAINDTTIAILGGIGPSNGEYSTTDQLQIYDIPSDKWSTAASAPIKVNHPNVAAVNGKIYLLGGLIDGVPMNGSVNWEATRDSAVYDPASNKWTSVEPMPKGTERGSAITAVDGEMVYLAGGMSILQSRYQDTVTTVTAFNTTSEKWQRLPPAAANIPEGRQHGYGFVIDNTFYVVGGRWFGQRNGRGDVFSLNLEQQEAGWKTGPNKMPTPRGGVSGGVVDGKIYTFGGEGNPTGETGVFNETEVYDVATQEWTKLKPMAMPRHGTSGVAVGRKIYIPGGGRQQDGKPVDHNGTITTNDMVAHLDAYCV